VLVVRQLLLLLLLQSRAELTVELCSCCRVHVEEEEEEEEEEEGCYTGRTRSYAATETSQVWTQPEWEGGCLKQTPPLKACYAHSVCSQIL
jgi:hypothetical protein